MKKINPLRKIAIYFVINLVIFFSITSLMNYALRDEGFSKPLILVFIQSIVTALALTVFFEWRFIKDLFSKKSKEDETT
ncbi:MAG: hypothetical protein ABIW38_00260 [Ferruginibacter sp.]